MVYRDFDDVLKRIGGMGMYQWFQFGLLLLLGDGINPWNAFSIVFTTYTPGFRCKSDSSVDFKLENNLNKSIPEDGVEIIISDSYNSECYSNGSVSTISQILLNNSSGENDVIGTSGSSCTHGYDYDKSLLASTVVTDWDLVCDNSFYVPLLRNVLFASSVVGLVTMSYVQDRFGRKPALITCIAAIAIGNLGSYFATTMPMFIAIRVIAEFASYSTYNTAYVWCLEAATPEHRTLVSTLFCGLYAIGNTALPLVAFWCGSWRILSLTTSLAFIPVLSYYWLCFESPRWLYTKGRFKDAFETLRASNSRSFNFRIKQLVLKQSKTSEELDKLLTESVDEKLSMNDDSDTMGAKERLGEAPTSFAAISHPTAVDLFRRPNLRKKTIILYFCLVVNNLSYMTAAYNMENIGGNFMVNFALQAVLEGPAIFLNLFILNRFGRIRPTVITMALSGFCLVLTTAADLIGSPMLVILMTMGGKFFICISFAILFQLCVELFPTELRATGLATGTLLGAILNMVIPYITYLSKYYKLLPQVLIGFITIVAAIVSLMLPETRGSVLPETVNDAERCKPAGIATAIANMSIDGSSDQLTELKQNLQTPEDEMSSRQFANDDRLDVVDWENKIV